MTGKAPLSENTTQPGHAVRAMAVVGAVFTLVFLGLMIANGYRQYVVGTQEETRLTVQKRQLLQEPDNTALVDEIRRRDLAIRANKLRQLDFAAMGSLMLLVSAAITVGACKWLAHLNGIDPQPSADIEEPFRQRRQGASRFALVMSAFLLVAMTFFLVQRVPSEWVIQAGTGFAASDKPEYASPEELARNWHRFRGFAGAGVTFHDDIPTQWDGTSGSGIRWKTKIPLPGHNSPVVWQNRIFLSGATEEKREVYCLDATSGDILWTGEVPTAPMAGNERLEVMEETGLAASTMATDGFRIYAIFGTGDLAAFDFNGHRLWHKNLGIPESVYGYATSLEVWQDKVLVQYDQAYVEDGKSRLFAFDGATGKVTWETKRPVANSWASPIVGRVGNDYQLITVGAPWVIAYHPNDGKEIWRAECMDGDVAASPILTGNLVIAIEPNIQSMAIGAEGTGDVTKTHVVWRNEDVGPEIASPTTDGQRVFLIDAYGTLFVVNAKDGKLLYEHDFDETVNASPSLAAGKLYVLAMNGTMFIGTPGEAAYTLETKNALGEECHASPAFMAGRIYIRGKEHLYCIENE